MTSTPVATLADLENRDRARALDVRECDAKRGLAVQVHAMERDLAASQLDARERRNSRLCRWFSLACQPRL